MGGANEEVWLSIFRDGNEKLKSYKRLHRLHPPYLLPRAECKLCLAPFEGIGGVLMRMRGVGRSITNRYCCTRCWKFIEKFPGGAEVELSIFFVDLRGSVSTAERMTPADFSRLIGAFYVAACKAIMDADGFVMDLVGDEVVGTFPPGMVGKWHARKAIKAAQDLLHARASSAPAEFSMPFGVGIHTGNVYVGTVPGAAGGIQDVRAIGDNVNVTARLAQMAGKGEALISDAAFIAAEVNPKGLESRQLSLKGRSEPIAVHVMRQDSPMLSVELPKSFESR